MVTETQAILDIPITKGICHFGDMTKKSGNNIAILREAKGMTQKELAEAIGTSPMQMSRLERGLRDLRPHWIRALCGALDCSPDQLLGYEAPTLGGDSTPKEPSITIPPVDVDFTAGPRDLPIVGNVRGGDQAFFLDNGEVQGMVHRPGPLIGVPNAFACYMTGDSMEPRFEEGELLYVNPIKPPRPGHYVLIELQDHQAYVKKLVRRAGDMVIVEQFNPKREITYPAQDVRHIYRVVGQFTDQ